MKCLKLVIELVYEEFDDNDYSTEMFLMENNDALLLWCNEIGDIGEVKIIQVLESSNR